MGKVRQGILDGFVGKVGTVVGSFWKGMKVMRGYNEFPNNPNTDDQQFVRAKFRVLGSVGGALNVIIRMGLGASAEANHSTAIGEFVRVNWVNGTTGSTPSQVALNASAIKLAAGTLTPVSFGEVDLSTPATLKVAILEGFYDNRINSARDQVFVVAHEPQSNQVMYTAGTRTQDDDIVLGVPSFWSGKSVNVWAFVKGDREGSDPDNCSDTIWLGSNRIR